MRSNFGRRLRQPHRASTLTKLYRARLNVANSTTGSRSNVSSDTWSFDLATRQLEPELATESAAARQVWEEENKSKVGGRDDNDTRPSIAAPPTQAIKVIRFRPSQFSLSLSRFCRLIVTRVADTIVRQSSSTSAQHWPLDQAETAEPVQLKLLSHPFEGQHITWWAFWWTSQSSDYDK